jgi:hypothetical protein
VSDLLLTAFQRTNTNILLVISNEAIEFSKKS